MKQVIFKYRVSLRKRYPVLIKGKIDHRPDIRSRNHTGLIGGNYMQSKVIIEPVNSTINISVLKFVYNGQSNAL